MINNIAKKFYWGLDQRRGIACKLTCPHCGQKKCFKPYVIRETGEMIDETCGRCDHEQSCGYHLTPTQFFDKNPLAKEQFFREHTLHGFDYHRSPIERVYQTIAPPPVPEYKYLPIEMAEAQQTPDLNLVPWLLKVIPNKERVKEVLDLYRVGSQRDKNGFSYALFWYIDADGHLCDGKLMGYRPDGHRNGKVNWVASQLAQMQPAENTRVKRCLYGEQLISRFPEAKIALVESEKSALVCSCLLPDYLWLATGGCSNLSIEAMKPLNGRSVTIFPDSGMLAKWKEKLEGLKEVDYRFYEGIEKYPPNTDLADILLQKLSTSTQLNASAETGIKY